MLRMIWLQNKKMFRDLTKVTLFGLEQYQYPFQYYNLAL